MCNIMLKFGTENIHNRFLVKVLYTEYHLYTGIVECKHFIVKTSNFKNVITCCDMFTN
jgi:hypothetical protein